MTILPLKYRGEIVRQTLLSGRFLTEPFNVKALDNLVSSVSSKLSLFDDNTKFADIDPILSENSRFCLFVDLSTYASNSFSGKVKMGLFLPDVLKKEAPFSSNTSASNIGGGVFWAIALLKSEERKSRINTDEPMSRKIKTLIVSSEMNLFCVNTHFSLKLAKNAGA